MNRHFGLVPALGLFRQLGRALCLALVITAPSVYAAPGATGAQDVGPTDAYRVEERQPDARPEATQGASLAVPEPAAEAAGSAKEPPVEAPAGLAESGADSAFVQGQDNQTIPEPLPERRGKRSKSKSRLTGLAAMAARIVTEANLRSAGTFEAPRGMVDPRERKILLRRPEPSPPINLPAAPPPVAMGVLDDSIVKEIGQRKTMFRMCYESARRRGVSVTRADVKWKLSPDGSVRDVVVEVTQDELLSRCIRVIASRPFPTPVAQEVPVAIPLLFVSER